MCSHARGFGSVQKVQYSAESKTKSWIRKSLSNYFKAVSPWDIQSPYNTVMIPEITEYKRIRGIELIKGLCTLVEIFNFLSLLKWYRRCLAFFRIIIKNMIVTKSCPVIMKASQWTDICISWKDAIYQCCVLYHIFAWLAKGQCQASVNIVWYCVVMSVVVPQINMCRVE